jgi:diphosphomevalonate decarboxylase
MDDKVVTAVGTPNMALIKYWGKRDDRLILPTNSSVSMTLNEQLNTKTSVLFSKKLKEDKIYINGTLQDLNNSEIGERLIVLNLVRDIAKDNRKALVVSKNSFPTSSGLASSASGLATLVYASSKALGLDLSPKGLSMIARRGSGSASRSLMGGIVKWTRGAKADGSDSYAEQVAPPEHWPELRDVVVIFTEAKKKISSRAGMKQTVQTGILYKSRLDYIEGAVKRLEEAVKKKDFETLGQIIMRDAMNMHAVMLDTWPPIMYLDDNSKQAIYKIHELNQSEGKIVAAYTFDAGSNANIITLSKYVGKVRKVFEGMDSVKSMLELKMGDGPRLLPEKESLIDKRRMVPLGAD